MNLKNLRQRAECMTTMKRSALIPAVTIGVMMVAAWPAETRAQTQTVEALSQSQAVMLRRLFADLGSASPQRQLFALWTADLMLTPGQGPLGAVGVEDAVSVGALPTLMRLSGSANAEIAQLAKALSQRIIDELEIASATPAAAQVIDDVGSDAVQLERGNYDRWLQVRTVAGREYYVEARGCPIVRVTVLGSDRQRGIAGGTAYGARFRFSGQMDETAFMRIRTPLCPSDSGNITISSALPARMLTGNPTRSMPQPVVAGERFRGALSGGVEHWFSLSVQPGQRYVVSTIPENDVLDTVLTAFGPDGTEISSDDDGGIDLGSRLELVRPAAETILLKVHVYDGEGGYEFVLSSAPSPFTSAKAVSVGSQDGRLAGENLEQWWRVTAQAGNRFTFETLPDGSLDTVLTLFDSDGVTELMSDDDGGATGLGSRLEFSNSNTQRDLFLKVSSIDDGRGAYKLVVTPLPPGAPLRFAESASSATVAVAPGRYQSSLNLDAQQWFRVNVPADRPYVIETIPTNNLDTLLTVFASDGTTEIASNDDDGPGRGSRVEFTNRTSPYVLVRVSRVGTGRGDYDVAITEKPRPIDVAREAPIGAPQMGTLTDDATEQWWRIEARRGQRYVFETAPSGGLDTVITLYEMDGATELGSDDDGGTNSGSRLTFQNTTERTFLLLKVLRYGSSTGSYRLTITATP